MPDREKARALAREYAATENPLGWFEPFYAAAKGDHTVISWADLSPNPHLLEWFTRQHPEVRGRALIVGCGLGDDAEELVRRGFDITAFDISPTAIDWCRRRFPDSKCEYVAADVLKPPAQWFQSFDFIFEAYTLQVIPKDLRAAAMEKITSFVAPGGTLLVVCRGREANDPEGNMPWPITKSELDGFTQKFGLLERNLEVFFDQESPPVRRFRIEYTRSV